MRIKPAQITRCLILLTLTLVISMTASATDLSGKVTEVIDGNTINLKSLSHTIKVRLLAVAPPEKTQPYADVARKHLSDLILGKYVVVRYTGIGEQGYLVGRILLEQADINAQMLRDGVAWYYQPDESDLAEADRHLYAACESAARGEQRGLWQDPSPVSPWAFRKSQMIVIPKAIVVPAAPPRDPFVAPPAPPQQAHVRTARPSGLTSEDMMGGALVPGTVAGQPEIKSVSPGIGPGSWVRFAPDDRHFSVLAPSGGVAVTLPVLEDSGRLVQVHYFSGEKDGAFYGLMWTRGSGKDATAVAAATVAGLEKGLNNSLREQHLDFVVTTRPVRNVTISGYVGKEYRLSGGWVSGIVRVVSKQIGDDTEVFMLLVLDRGEVSGEEFLSSLKLSR